MLGNFSFGDYFKEYAIELAWNLVTKEFLLDRAKLLVTVHSSDEEAAVLWKKIAGLSDKSIIRISTSDNFWAMGDTGPCGPCSKSFSIMVNIFLAAHRDPKLSTVIGLSKYGI